MDYQKTDISLSRARIRVTIDSAEINELLDKTLLEVGKILKLPGFEGRPIPISLIKKHFFPEQIQVDFMAKFKESAVQSGLDFYKIKNPGLPGIMEEKQLQSGLSLEFEIDYIPQFALPDTYLDFEIEIPEPKWNDVLFNAAEQSFKIAHLQLDNVTDRDVVQLGDIVFTEMELKITETDYCAKESFALSINNDPAQLNQIETCLVGRKIGETISTTLAIPITDIRTQLAGDKAAVKYTIKSIAKGYLEQSKEELYQRFGLTSEAEYRDKIKADYNFIPKIAGLTQLAGEVLQRLINQYLPEALPEFYVQSLMAIVQEFTEHNPCSLQLLWGQVEGQTSEIQQNLGDLVTQIGKRFIIEAVIAQKEGLEVKEEELAAYLFSIAQSPGATVEATLDFLRRKSIYQFFKQNLLSAKVSEFIIQKLMKVPPTD